MRDNWELVNFAIALVNSVLNLLMDDWFFFFEESSNYRAGLLKAWLR